MSTERATAAPAERTFSRMPNARSGFAPGNWWTSMARTLVPRTSAAGFGVKMAFSSVASPTLRLAGVFARTAPPGMPTRPISWLLR